jgi:putative redox protein
MEVSIHHIDGMNFEAKTKTQSFLIEPKKVSPIEIFALGMISCSGTDIIAIPQSQGFSVENLSVKANITRAEEMPKKFTAIELFYSFNSNADKIKAKRWVQSSIETYCSTLNTVRGVANIIYNIEYNGEIIAKNEEIISSELDILANNDEIATVCPS